MLGKQSKFEQLPMYDATPQNSDAEDEVAIFKSIVGSSDAFVYRCKNDAEYTMTFMAGCVRQLTGFNERQILGNHEVGYVSLCHLEDSERMIAIIDEAIDARRSWDVDYRLVQPDGSAKWVREHGNAVYDDQGELVFLQGLVVDASAEVALREELDKQAEVTSNANDEILKLAENISGSVRMLGMLSINARIEAARAGDAGQGFAIVANEMNSLARVNAEWAEKIAERMQN